MRKKAKAKKDKTVTRREALAYIEKHWGMFVTLVFVKRSTGEEREMTFRQGVTEHLAGGEPAYDFSEKGLLPVYDMVAKGYRSVPKEGIVRIKMKGVWHKVK